MPQKSGVLNALRRARRRLARALGRPPAPGTRLAPAEFIAHAAALAAKAEAPEGLWLSFLVDAAPADLPRTTLAELVVCDPRLDPAERWREALGRARAPFVARLDASGRLAPFAIERIAAALSQNPDAWALYTDEAITERARPVEIVLKPAFDPVLLDSFDYFGRIAVYARAVAEWREDGPSGDYELALRIAAGAPSGAILHLPYPAFLGPARPFDPGWGIAADRLRPTGVPGPRRWPKVSVVIPSRDAPALIGRTLAGLFEATDYRDFDVTVVDNGSTDPETLALYARFAGDRFHAEVKPAPFNFSRAVNCGAALSRGALICCSTTTSRSSSRDGSRRWSVVSTIRTRES